MFEINQLWVADDAAICFLVEACIFQSLTVGQDAAVQVTFEFGALLSLPRKCMFFASLPVDEEISAYFRGLRTDKEKCSL